MRIWVFNLFLLLACVCSIPPAGAESSVVKLGAGCSGVVVHSEYVVSAKHCVDGARRSVMVTGENGKQSLAFPVFITPADDGPVVYRVAPGLFDPMPLAEGPPAVGSRVDLVARSGGITASGTVVGLQKTRSYHPRTGRTLIVEGNQVNAMQQGGSSGGAAVQDGELVGLVLSGAGDSTTICTFESLQRSVNGVLKAYEAQPVVTVFCIKLCGGCEQFKRELNQGLFVRVPVRWHVVQVDDPAAYPHISGYPAFQVEDRPVVTFDRYDGQIMADWVREEIRKLPLRPVGSLNSAASKSVAEAAPSPPPAEPIVDVDWSGLRFIGMADSSGAVSHRLLAGSFRRLIEMISGGRATLEVVTSRDQPDKYAALMEAGQFTLTDARLVVLVDKIADVGLVKGLVLKKIEAAVLESLRLDRLPVEVELILKRTSPKDYAAVLAAANIPDVVSAESSLPPPVEDLNESETETAVPWVSRLMGVLLVVVIGRVVRWVAKWRHAKQEHDRLAVDSPLAPAWSPAEHQAYHKAAQPAPVAPVMDPQPSAQVQPPVPQATPQAAPTAPVAPAAPQNPSAG